MRLVVVPIIVALIFLCFGTVAFATSALNKMTVTDAMRLVGGYGNTSITVSFNETVSDIKKVSPAINAVMSDIDTIFKENGVEHSEVQSINYTISPENYAISNGVFRYYANISYSIAADNKAATLVSALSAKGFQANVNANTYCRPGALVSQ